ncbi:MAG: PQQ-binding-like beta-propeller repeat protein [Planctomycetes bacterium]|nr:PQQ-binding-like beta-propeller repeat protein [Planctomycetota bacterium]
MRVWIRLAFSLLLVIWTLNAGDWPRFRGPKGDGISDEVGVVEKWSLKMPSKKWQASVGTGFSSMVVAKDRVYTMGNREDTDIVSCLDALSGKEIWNYRYPCSLAAKYYKGGPGATPTLWAGKVYTFSKDGQVYCLDAVTGAKVWGKELKKDLGLELPKWGFASSPFVMGKLLILNAGASGVALDLEKGSVKWSSGKAAGGYATPVLWKREGREELLLFSAGHLNGLDPQSGKVAWSHPWKTSYDVNAADPVVAGERVFITSGYKTGCTSLSVKGEKVKVLWTNKALASQMSTPVLREGFLYGIDGNAGGGKPRLKCLELATGKELWAKEGFGCGSLILAGDRLIILSESGELVIAAADPSAFKEYARAKVLSGVCWTSPVLAGGRLYVRSGDGDLVCLEAGE